MTIESLPAAEITPSRITLDYLERYERVSHFYPYHFRERKFRKVEIDREGVVKVLREYNRRIEAPQKVMENIEMLLDENTYTVVTGQQPGIFTGPLYTIYKALSAIIVANNHSDKKHPLVPIFWNASEDHDLSEVDHIYLMHNNYPRKISYPVRGEKSTSEIRLDKEKIDRMIANIEEFTPDTEFKDSILEKLVSICQRRQNLAQVFSKLMLSLLGDFGLILIEPKDLKKLMIPVFKKLIENPTRCSKILSQEEVKLKELGYSPRIHKRSDFCNFLVERKSVIYRGKFHVGENVYSSEEMLDWLEKNPSAFSANVVTRPLIQDWILPTYAYVAGPSEIAYFAQLKRIYEEFEIEMPLIWPRFGATIVENKILKVLNKYHFEILDLRFPELLTKELARKKMDSLFGSARSKILETFSPVEEAAVKIDRGLRDSSQASLRKALRAMDILEDKVARRLKRQNIIMQSQINKAAHNIFPLQDLQERKLNVLEYLIKFGQDFLRVVHGDFSKADYGEHKVISFQS